MPDTIPTISEIAAACNPERVIRPCVGCETFDHDPHHCAVCYASLYPRADSNELPAWQTSMMVSA